jgi:hypothetical protein
MATVLTTLNAVQSQIRGPALIGPGLQIRGPGVLTAQCPLNVTDFTGRFDAAVAMNQGPVGILVAADDAEIAELVSLWPILPSAGWLVGTQTSDADLQQAYEDAGDGNPLRILIARRTADIVTLTSKWHGCP